LGDPIGRKGKDEKTSKQTDVQALWDSLLCVDTV